MNRWPRWAAQLVSLAILVLLPTVGLWGITADSVWAGPELAARYGVLAPEATALAEAALDEPVAVGANVGMPFSIRLLGIELSDPLALGMLLSAGVLPPFAMLLGGLLVILFNVLFGRAFCGYLCPYGIVSRLVSRLRPPLVRRGLALRLGAPPWIRFALLGAVVALPAAGWSVGYLVLPYLSLGRAVHALFFGAAFAWFALVAALLLVDLLLGDHLVCRSLCPSGAAQRLVAQLRLPRLKMLRGVSCESGCSSCRQACWLGLDPRRASKDPDCDACGRCIPVCPVVRLEVGLGTGRERRITGLAVLAILIPLGSCARSSPPEVIDPEDPWRSAFTASVESDQIAEIAITETSVEEGMAMVGLARLAEDRAALRIYLLDAAGETWREPIEVELTTAAGSTVVAFERPLWPRGAPRPSFYEQHLRLDRGASLRFLDGPVAGLQLAVPEPADDSLVGSGLDYAIPILVLGFWLVMRTWRGCPARSLADQSPARSWNR